MILSLNSCRLVIITLHEFVPFSLFREKIHYIRTEGNQGLEKLSCDADLVILLRCTDFLTLRASFV